MQPVDLALCLAVDCSASVDYDEFGLMLGGYAAAFREPAVAAALAAGPHGAVAVCLLLWSGPAAQAVGQPWTRLEGAADSAGFGAAVDATPRLVTASSTALGDGMAAGLALLARVPTAASRHVLDIAGDGRNNSGRLPGPMRDVAVAAGITVNALAVLNEEPELLGYYQREVIGGPGAFAMACADYGDFATAILAKLLREIGASPTA
jgi:hypothetical protein